MIPDHFMSTFSRLRLESNLSCHPNHRAQQRCQSHTKLLNHDAKIRIESSAMSLQHQQTWIPSWLHGVNHPRLAFLTWNALVLSRRGSLEPLLLPHLSLFPVTSPPFRPEYRATRSGGCTPLTTHLPTRSYRSSQDVYAVKSRGRLAKVLQGN